jgi:hypothetical protein
MGADLGWGDARQSLEIDAYLAFARREFSVAPPGVGEERGAASAVVRDVEPAAVD